MNRRPDGLEIGFHFASKLGVAVKCGSQSLCESREAHERRSDFKEVTREIISDARITSHYVAYRQEAVQVWSTLYVKTSHNRMRILLIPSHL